MNFTFSPRHGFTAMVCDGRVIVEQRRPRHASYGDEADFNQHSPPIEVEIELAPDEAVALGEYLLSLNLSNAN